MQTLNLLSHSGVRKYKNIISLKKRSLSLGWSHGILLLIISDQIALCEHFCQIIQRLKS